MEKTIENLGLDDLLENPVWYFPMENDNVGIVRPVLKKEDINDFPVVIKTIFTSKEGNNYYGFIYWAPTENVEIVKPILVIDDDKGLGLSFWTGIIEPDDNDFEAARGYLSRKSFPITFESEEAFDLYPIKGELEGIYYFNGKREKCVKKIPF